MCGYPLIDSLLVWISTLFSWCFSVVVVGSEREVKSGLVFRVLFVSVEGL